jgi:predicted RNase H-like HicB family nuclease
MEAQKTIKMNLIIETEQEKDGRWIAEAPDLPGALAYGTSRQEAITKVEALALRILADRLEHGETSIILPSISFVAA